VIAKASITVLAPNMRLTGTGESPRSLELQPKFSVVGALVVAVDELVNE
jgi:hypothetical protein